MVRRKLIAGNWKMNAAMGELDAIADTAAASSGVDVAVCPPFTYIAAVKARLPGLLIGAQDVHAEAQGAHTGSLSASMLQEAGASLVIVGHSERRDQQYESDAAVRAKAEAALRAGFTTVICVGESEADRDAGDALSTVGAQLEGSLPDELSDGLVVAYEPIWAIGTGKTAGKTDIAEMHAGIRERLVARYGPAGEGVRILYGGSVKPDNAAKIFAIPNVDGALVGGASLKASSFVPIIQAAAG